MSKLIKRAFLDTEDGQIHYRIGGEGEPLLLLHMNPRSSDEYRELMPLLARKYRVMAMDFMGFGDSDKPPRQYSVADYAKTIIALLDEIGIEKANILGNHTGTFVSGEVAAAYPDRVNKLILANIDYFDERNRAEIHNTYHEALQIQEDGSHLIERWKFFSSYIDSIELRHRYFVDELKCHGYPPYGILAVIDYTERLVERLGLISCPTLILSGTEDIKELERLGFATPENRQLITKVISHAKAVDIEGGTRCMMNQMPEEISKVVVDFLTQSR
jgi:pimeloyl-ACP methyl ester carboxylesterase